jgi:hypothetical protein
VRNRLLFFDFAAAAYLLFPIIIISKIIKNVNFTHFCLIFYKKYDIIKKNGFFAGAISEKIVVRQQKSLPPYI